MKILGLYNNECAIDLFDWIAEQGHEVIMTCEKLDAEWCRDHKFDLAVSYTYRYIISKELLAVLNNNVVNIHNSYLPWNRGADPNIWSIVDDTPRGVTIHYMDDELDKGFVIAQELLCISDDETLASSYYFLDSAAKELFKKTFLLYDYWDSMKKRCVGKGSYHSIKDGLPIKSLIDSYNIKISDFKDKLMICKFET